MPRATSAGCSIPPRRTPRRTTLTRDLYVVSAFVGAGPTLKRWKARARGRVGRIKKRTCHITIALAPPAGEAIPALIERPAPVTLTEEPEPIVVDDATGEVVEGEAAVEEAPVEEKPKRTRAPRKKPAEPKAEAEIVEAEAPEAEEAEEAPKPKRTRAAKPKAEAETAEPEAEAKPKTTREEDRDDRERRGERRLVGQKIHPGGLRVGVIHDWKSNWYTGAKEFPAYIIEDVKIRDHIYGKLGTRASRTSSSARTSSGSRSTSTRRGRGS
jgi:outer membrane biosynthesis protein TonB